MKIDEETCQPISGFLSWKLFPKNVKFSQAFCSLLLRYRRKIMWSLGRNQGFGFVLTFAFMAVLLLFSQISFAETNGNTSIFLPIVSHEKSTISGLVTFGSQGPWPDVKLDLRFFNGSEWSTLASTTTDSDGIYIFNNVPTLQSGQSYYVRYLNTEAEGFLYTWHAKLITSFQAGQEVSGGDFSIAGIYLQSPPAGSQLAVPINFRWSKRSGQTADSYELNLFEPQTGSPYFYTNPPLGFVDEYTLSSLPVGFNSGTWYVWNIWVYGEGGDIANGWGISYWTYYLRLYGAPNSELGSIHKINSAEILPDLAIIGQFPVDLDLGK